MAESDGKVASTISKFLTRVKRDRKLDNDTALFGEGLGLDSLETAELSAMLEDELGTDPFSAGETPETVGDILSFYEAAPDA